LLENLEFLEHSHFDLVGEHARERRERQFANCRTAARRVGCSVVLAASSHIRLLVGVLNIVTGQHLYDFGTCH
jgi:hypothetical protein